jgi:hypothetical protein
MRSSEDKSDVTIGIRVNSHDFMDTYRSIENDTVAYRLRIWICTCYEGHNMVHTLQKNIESTMLKTVTDKS